MQRHAYLLLHHHAPKISKACVLTQASILLSLSFPFSRSSSVCIFVVFLHKTYEFVSFVQDKMKQTELGEMIGTLRQEWAETEEEGPGGKNGYIHALQSSTVSELPSVAAGITAGVYAESGVCVFEEFS